MGKTLGAVKEYATIAFTLLGVLFGMMIMTFIFGQLGQSNNLADISSSKINESQKSDGIIAFLNQTGYEVIAASYDNFTSANIDSVWASVDTAYPYNVSVPSSNYTIDSLGVLRNATTKTLSNISVSYTYNYKSEAEMSSLIVEDRSLESIVTYTDNSSTQFTTVSIAVILVLLVGVFLLFWKIFVSEKKGKSFGGNFA